MRFNPEIFRAYDIRGIYGKDFDEDFAFKLGWATVKHLNRKKFLVAHGDREFSDKLAESVVGGIVSAGGDAEFLKTASTPFFNFVFNDLGVNGGIMVTASHVKEYRGFKLVSDKAGGIGLGSGLENIKKLMETESLDTSKYGGRKHEASKPELVKKYANFIIKHSGIARYNLKKLKVSIDVLPIQKSETELILSELKIESCRDNCEIRFSFDPDADRLIVLNEQGEAIRMDYIAALLAKDMLRLWSKPKVVYDFRFSRGVLEKFREWGVRHYRSRVGWTFLKEKARKYKAGIAGELSGHIMFKETHYSEMPLLAMLKILKIMTKSGKGIEELTKPFKTWENSGEINIAFSGQRLAFSEILAGIKEKHKDGKINELDGITAEYDDWWFNLRPSNTEPIVRLIVEAKNKELMENKIKEIMEEVNKR